MQTAQVTAVPGTALSEKRKVKSYSGKQVNTFISSGAEFSQIM